MLSEKVTASPSEFRSRRCYKCNEPSYQPVLVPPSWDKSEYNEIIRPVWIQAVKELKEATRICIVGYSMPEADAFFKFLLTISLSQNHQLYKLFVVDKADTVRARYEDLLDSVFKSRRCSYDGSGFENCLTQFPRYRQLGRGEAVASVNLY